MDPRVLKIYPSAVSRRLVDNPNNYDGQVSMPFLIKMCFTKKQQILDFGIVTPHQRSQEIPLYVF